MRKIAAALLMSAPLMSIAAGPAMPAPGQWTVFEQPDKMTDTVNVFAISLSSTPDKSTLIFRCGGNGDPRMSAGILFETFLGESGAQFRQLMYRVDSQPAVTMQPRYIDKTAFIQRSDTAQFARAVTSGKRMMVRVSTFQDHPVETEFKLDDAADAIRRAAAMCKVDSPI